MASTFAALANGGDIYCPILVDSIRRMENRKYVSVMVAEPTTYLEGVIDRKIVDTLQPMIRAVITSGTGRPINVEGMGLRGKTGTAQLGSDNSREIAWIIAFNTEGNEKKLVCVMVDAPSGKGGARNPVAKGLFEEIKRHNAAGR